MLFFFFVSVFSLDSYIRVFTVFMFSDVLKILSSKNKLNDEKKGEEVKVKKRISTSTDCKTTNRKVSHINI